MNNFAQLSNELLDEFTELIESSLDALDGDDRDDAESILQTIAGNLTKIADHGRRADNIVRNMLLHSREGPSELQRVALSPITEEALNLLYHGARAESPGSNIEMITRIDPDVGEVDCYPQDLMRVFLNLITNGMYAAGKRRAEAGEHFCPTLTLITRRVNGSVVIEVLDNGVGIPPELKE